MWSDTGGLVIDSNAVAFITFDLARKETPKNMINMITKQIMSVATLNALSITITLYMHAHRATQWLRLISGLK